MQKRRVVSIWSGVIASGVMTGLLLASCFGSPYPAQLNSLLGVRSDQKQTTLISTGLRGSGTFAELADMSSEIVVGKVVSISPVQWNQDSGEPWGRANNEQMIAMPLRYIEVEVIQSIVDGTHPGARVQLATHNEVTVIDEKGNVLNQEDLVLGLKVDDQAVFFVWNAKLAWRDGVRPTKMLMGTDTYFKLEKDGLYHGELLEHPIDLDSLTQKILDERTTPAVAP